MADLPAEIEETFECQSVTSKAISVANIKANFLEDDYVDEDKRSQNSQGSFDDGPKMQNFAGKRSQSVFYGKMGAHNMLAGLDYKNRPIRKITKLQDEKPVEEKNNSEFDKKEISRETNDSKQNTVSMNIC